MMFGLITETVVEIIALIGVQRVQLETLLTLHTIGCGKTLIIPVLDQVLNIQLYHITQLISIVKEVLVLGMIHSN